MQRMILIRLTMLLGLLLLLSYQNCAPSVNFEPSPSVEPDRASGNPAPSPSPAPIPAPPGPVVCDPFGGGTTSATSGLVANGVYYINPNLPSGLAPIDVINNQVANFFVDNANISHVNASVILNSINFPSMYFSQGFSDAGGNVLKANDGSLLDEYFGLRIKSNFVIGSWAPGDYEIGTLTDDGSVLTMTGGHADGTDLVVNNDGHHSLSLACSTGVLHVTANSKIPMNFDYFQGPRTTIGLMMVYRPVSVAGTAVDPFCGVSQTDSYFFLDHDSNGNALVPSAPQAPYLTLSGPFQSKSGTGGWKVVEPEHFQLPNNTPNPCAN